MRNNTSISEEKNLPRCYRRLFHSVSLREKVISGRGVSHGDAITRFGLCENWLQSLALFLGYTRVISGKSYHSAAILETPPGYHFGLIRPGPYLND